MNWLSEYEAKRTSAEDAVRAVRSGDTVYIHPGCANPESLVEALLGRAHELRNVEILHLLTFGNTKFVDPEFEGVFRGNALFTGGNVRKAINEGRADYIPIFLHEIENLFSSGEHPVDVVLCQVSPPDKYGCMSLGVGVDCTLTAARHAKHVIAEVNPKMPRTFGDCFLHIEDIDAIVEVGHDLPELHPEPADDIQRRIAENVSGLIPDGATLQMGIGAIPDAVLAGLVDHRNLGIHTEMFSDGVIPLIESGVLNGAHKTLKPGKLVAGFVLGTRTLFDFINDNPTFEFHPIRYVNDPFVIAQNDKMIAINSAIEVDITGQVSSDSIGTRVYSGFGGQVDFMRGAARSRGGKPVIALPSTAKNGTVSRIAATLTPGAGVVTSRADVHYVVTEHGVAYLHGKNLRQRAEALISIADPRFRDELYDFAARAHYLEARPALVC
jgi:4-hydroxybutyrate CoA-transferase